MTRKIEVPDIQLAGLYYPEWLEALTRFKRNNVPELTDESPYEPLQQLLRAFALVGHMNSVLVDLVANESTLPTARLASSVRNQLRLINYRMRPASPSKVDVLVELARVTTTTTTVVPVGALFATPRTEAEDPLFFEHVGTDVAVTRTDHPTAVFSFEDGVFTDRTAAALAFGTTFTPWATPAAGDMLLVGHENAMWDRVTIDVTTGALGVVGVWEFHDGSTDDEVPDSVANQGPNLRFDINDLLGTANRAGAVVRVSFDETGAAEDRISQWDGFTNFITTNGLMGQSTPSVIASDYTVGTLWKEIVGVIDGSVDFSVDGNVTFPVPQSLTSKWAKTIVNGILGFWLRYRIVSVTAPTAPVVDVVGIAGGKQYVIVEGVTQGRTQTDGPLGSSNGSPSQRFVTTRDSFVDGSMQVLVNGVAWVEVENFLNSLPTDTHFRVELGDKDLATVVFGDGVLGAIPPVGANNVTAIYRFGLQTDGNVGANAVTIDKGALANANRVTNPRPASGWSSAEGADEASLEKAKLAGPASLRTKGTALGPSDVESMAIGFTDDDGSRPFSRAKAIEEGLGPKTIELVLVARGGTQPSPTQLASVEAYFNGDDTTTPKKPKRIVGNHRVYARAFTPVVIDVDAIASGNFVEAEVVNGVAAVLQPEAFKPDGTTPEWDFGDTIPISRLVHEIFAAVDDGLVEKVTISTPAVDVQLGPRELPVAGVMNIVKI